MDPRLGHGGVAQLPYPDLTEALQARILADLKAEKVCPMPGSRLDPAEPRRVGALEAHIDTLEEAVAKAEALGRGGARGEGSEEMWRGWEGRWRAAASGSRDSGQAGRRSCCRARRHDERAHRDVEADGRTDGSNGQFAGRVRRISVTIVVVATRDRMMSSKKADVSSYLCHGVWAVVGLVDLRDFGLADFTALQPYVSQAGPTRSSRSTAPTSCECPQRPVLNCMRPD